MTNLDFIYKSKELFLPNEIWKDILDYEGKYQASFHLSEYQHSFDTIFYRVFVIVVSNKLITSYPTGVSTGNKS